MSAAANAILFNSPALHALKRDQLVKLCKMHSIKANGKNPTAETSSGIFDHDDPFSSTEEPRARPATPPSEQYDVFMDSIAEEDEAASSAGNTLVSKTSKRTFKSSMTGSTLASEFGTSKSSSTMGSLKSLASSFGLKKSSKLEALLGASRPYSSIPESSPGSRPQTDHFTVDPTLLFDPSTLTLDTEPIPGHATRAGNPAPPNARLSLGLTPSTPSRPKGPSTTLRLVLNNAGSNIFATPKLKPFPTSFDLVLASPEGTKSSTCHELPESSIQHSYRLLCLQTPTTMRTEPFVFGSPLPQHQVSDAQFKSAAQNVLEQMNQRLQAQGIPEARTRKPSEVTKKFDQAHEAQFSQMQSIADAPSIRAGKKRTAALMEDPPLAASSRAPPTTSFHVPEPTAERRTSKRPRISMEPSKVEVNPDDPSTGRPSIKPAPKASRFGFISSAAKSIVSTFWSQGKANQSALPTKLAKAECRVSHACPSCRPKNCAASTSRRASKANSKSSLRVARISASSSLRQGSVNGSGARTASSTVSSLGARTAPSRDSTGTRTTQTSSRLLAPTASSLAKTAAAGSVPVTSPAPAEDILGPITNSAKGKDAEMDEPVEERAKKPSVSIPKAPPVVVQRSLSNRRPRISRGKVIAKLASQRAMSGKSGHIGTPGKVRSSLGTKQRAGLAS
ncbi:hypothetical protein DL96DRAFT_1578403 [Flagelloscypha sp. PMI_526]|nr:hypothetical protein DL96DRAFT_1578403 [Flagelloscypha sp. PMI_526]